MSLSKAVRIAPLEYRGYTIAARTYEVRGSGRWAVGVVIGRWGSLRAFDSQATAATEDGANEMSQAFARSLIDLSPYASSLTDLVGEPSGMRPPSHR
ncbi:MAG: hypothetical protein IPF87_07510 [Gemmatimonadetes bacterium]|nr:hypothetical protein [Gemmatimonadota bacterium]MBP9107576.1 hypothetical protein [Gemmatimonadaceae bacterium]MBK6455910.1 hypothetical protein [Gemmatimonadota bacterium]MBK6844972.1 hypothetical protein [Gemmatimonadota bacterium]MBK8647897.1 hypothetical protein [Gemmatimonadota bacterium]